MSKNNDVSKVLVANATTTVETAAGTDLDTLANNEIAVMDADTNLSLDAAGAADARNIYIALKDANGKLATSAGQIIQTRNIANYSTRAYTAPVAMQVAVTDYITSCDTDYTIKLEFRNQETYRRIGYNQFTHAYSVRTACCDGCEDCPSGDANELTGLFLAELNTNSLGLVSAEATARVDLTAATHGIGADTLAGDVLAGGQADLDAIIAYNVANPTTPVYSDLLITTIPAAVNDFCSINLKYYKPRQTAVVLSLVEGFSCTGKSNTVTELVYEEGAGYDIKQKEYHAGGNHANPGPYRTSNVDADYGIAYSADAALNYDQIALTYDQFSRAGWNEHLNNLSTVIALPVGSAVTAPLTAILDAVADEVKVDKLDI